MERVILIGDSIRKGYQEIVRQEVVGEVEVAVTLEAHQFYRYSSPRAFTSWQKEKRYLTVRKERVHLPHYGRKGREETA